MFDSWSSQDFTSEMCQMCQWNKEMFILETPWGCLRTTAFNLVSPGLETESDKLNVKLLMKWFHKLIAPVVDLTEWLENKQLLDCVKS